MKDTPLLMKGELVRATFADLKLVTRRLSGLGYINNNPEGWSVERDDDDLDLWHFRADGYGVDVRCPYGHAGDQLWVRETYRKNMDGEYRYQADGGGAIVRVWHPSIHMPKLACRLHLRIIDIRPERLQDITPEDCFAEGTTCWSCGRDLHADCDSGTPILHTHGEATTSFSIMWDKINRRHPWEDNPWVWRIQFERLP